MEPVTQRLVDGAGKRTAPSIEELNQLIPAYQFTAHIDSGGMGAVYRAIQKSLNRTVAVKILADRYLEDPGFAARFRREAQALAILNHPNVVAVYDSGQTSDGRLYYVMEFISGMNLHHLLRRQTLEPRRILEITLQVCQALEFAHNCGIIHRDIKPANILIDEHGNVKVADFGLAKITGVHAIDYTATGVALGTPDYIAPEAWEIGREIDHRVDIYSLGVMLYELLTGQLPKGSWEVPSVCAGTDKKVDVLVTRAMQSDPDKRYQTVGELTKELQRLVKGSDNWKKYRRATRATSELPKQSLRTAVDEDAMTLDLVVWQPPIKTSKKFRWRLVCGLLLLVLVMLWIGIKWAGVAAPKAMSAPVIVSNEAVMPAEQPVQIGSAQLQRELARWTFARGGVVNVLTPENVHLLNKPDRPATWPPPLVPVSMGRPLLDNGVKDIHGSYELPAGEFLIWRISFLDSPLAEVDFDSLLELIKNVGTVSHLNLRGLLVPTVALQKLTQMHTLRSLDLMNSPAVTRDAVPYLSACKQLRLLRIGGEASQVSESMILFLRSQLPECGVHDDP